MERNGEADADIDLIDIRRTIAMIGHVGPQGSAVSNWGFAVAEHALTIRIWINVVENGALCDEVYEIVPHPFAIKDPLFVPWVIQTAGWQSLYPAA